MTLEQFIQMKKYIRYDENSPSCLIRHSGRDNIHNKTRNIGVISRDRYLFTFKKQTYQCHRIVYQLFNGYIEDSVIIDHIDNDPKNNKIQNLRACTQIQNSHNHRVSKNNSLGVSGVYYLKAKKKYVAKISENSNFHYLGYYDTIEEATKVRREAEIKYYGEYQYGAKK